jgi:RNA polymerase sigma-70 factor (ECF subfamily)
MSPAASYPHFEELVRHERFVRSALRGLLLDEADVQDVVQETWLRVLRRPPASLREPARWLARVARNLALSSRRSTARRARREEARASAAEPEAAPDESLERVETRQRVVAAVLALEEPYRGVVLLRYERDSPPREIARRLGRSEATVRSQLSRAHALLRAKLDRDFGDRHRWAALAGPLAARPAAGLWIASVLGAAAAVALAWVAYARLAAPDDPARPGTVALAPPSAATPRASQARLAEPGGAEARVPMASQAQAGGKELASTSRAESDGAAPAAPAARGRCCGAG